MSRKTFCSGTASTLQRDTKAKNSSRQGKAIVSNCPLTLTLATYIAECVATLKATRYVTPRSYGSGPRFGAVVLAHGIKTAMQPTLLGRRGH